MYLLLYTCMRNKKYCHERTTHTQNATLNRAAKTAGFMSVWKAKGETVTVEEFASEDYETCISCEKIVVETCISCETENTATQHHDTSTGAGRTHPLTRPIHIHTHARTRTQTLGKKSLRKHASAVKQKTQPRHTMTPRRAQVASR